MKDLLHPLVASYNQVPGLAPKLLLSLSLRQRLILLPNQHLILRLRLTLLPNRRLILYLQMMATLQMAALQMAVLLMAALQMAAHLS